MQERSWLPVRRLREIPPAVWALGFVSLLMDTSSEIIHALLPVYLVTVLGTSMLTVGFIEGIAEATASITKVFSGALSDWLGKRKVLAVIGYGLAAFTKPVFPLASSIGAGLLHVSSTALEKAYEEPAGTRWSPTLPPRICEGRASDCGNRLIPSARFLDRAWPSV